MGSRHVQALCLVRDSSWTPPSYPLDFKKRLIYHKVTSFLLVDEVLWCRLGLEASQASPKVRGRPLQGASCLFFSFCDISAYPSFVLLWTKVGARSTEIERAILVVARDTMATI